MATVKRYRIYCSKCSQHFAVFAALFHTIDAEAWMKEKAENHDCKAHAEAMAKARSPRALNPIKASKKG